MPSQEGSEVLHVPALRITQNEYDLFIFTIDAKTLLSLAFFATRELDRENGVERPYSQRRSTQIWRFLNEEDATLPNNIIVSLRFKERLGEGYEPEYDEENKLLRLPKIPELAFVIDGQHRLRAFQNASDGHPLQNFPLVVTAFVDLPLAKIAEVFVNINYYQKPVNKSLVYDLVGISKEVFPRFFPHHRMTRHFNDTLRSPWYCQIKMLGIGKGIITQSTFIQALEENQILQILGDLDEVKQSEVLWSYFKVFQEVYRDYWCNPAYNLCKSVGFHAQMKFLAKLLKEKIDPKSLAELSRKQIIEKIRDELDLDGLKKLNFAAGEIRNLVGKKGATTLLEKFIEVGWK